MNQQIFPIEINFRNDLPLTAREKEILRYLSVGLQYKEIAEELHISLQTVKSHATSIYSKLKVNNRTEAIIKYIFLAK